MLSDCQGPASGADTENGWATGCGRNMCIRTVQAYGEFELLVFGDDVILNQPVEDWPLCDALLSWHSDGFPLRKARPERAASAELCTHPPACLHATSAEDALYGRSRAQGSTPPARYSLFFRP